MGQADSERFLRWFYDAENYRTQLMKRLSNVARYELRNSWDSDSQLDELIARLYKRAGMDSRELFPVPMPGFGAPEDQPDYEDVARYSQAAVRRIGRSVKNEPDDTVDPRSDDILSGNVVIDDDAVVAPAAASPFDTLVGAHSLPAWSSTLRVVRQKMAADERLAEPQDMPVFLEFLDYLIDDVESFSEWQEFALSHKFAPLMKIAEQKLFEAHGLKGHALRSFRTRFHHAFWRTSGELILDSPLPLEVPDELEHLSVYAGKDVRLFMVEHHEGMMRNRPRPFTPRGGSGRVPNRVLLYCGRATWWDNIVRRIAPAAPPLRPPTCFVLPSSEVRND